MKRTLVRLVLVALVGAAAWAAVAWPHLARVETGRTPEYPDLQPRSYASSPAQVSKAVTAAIAQLSGWTYVGSGRGPGGSQTHASARFPPCDVFIWVRNEKGKAIVSVKSESRYGPWDFGQNARNIRAFLAELDRQVAVN